MRLSITAIFVVAIFAVTIFASDYIEPPPPCADACETVVNEGMTKCQNSYMCMCSDKSIITSINSCVTKACDSFGRNNVVQSAVAFCLSYGVTLTPSLLEKASTSNAAPTLLAVPGMMGAVGAAAAMFLL